MKNFRLDYEDDEEEWDDEDDDDLIDEDEEGGPEDVEVMGPSYAPVYTGLLKANGDPIIRHPVVMRTGFHPERNQYHCPTLEDNGFNEEDGRIFGWVYD
ncbi:hypothetical protein RPALISO_209 [Ruegeria phage RpAliso]|nr:hypothetical protein RPALISO_209 [Ruegeria phage RpAliso]